MLSCSGLIDHLLSILWLLHGACNTILWDWHHNNRILNVEVESQSSANRVVVDARLFQTRGWRGWAAMYVSSFQLCGAVGHTVPLSNKNTAAIAAPKLTQDTLRAAARLTTVGGRRGGRHPDEITKIRSNSVLQGPAYLKRDSFAINSASLRCFSNCSQFSAGAGICGVLIMSNDRSRPGSVTDWGVPALELRFSLDWDVFGLLQHSQLPAACRRLWMRRFAVPRSCERHFATAQLSCAQLPQPDPAGPTTPSSISSGIQFQSPELVTLGSTCCSLRVASAEACTHTSSRLDWQTRLEELGDRFGSVS